MTLTLTIIDDKYSANDATGRKTLYFTGSFTNPYTAGGEIITVSSYFPNKWLGGAVESVDFNCSDANTGVARTGTFLGDANSTSVVALQLFNAGLSGTASAGLFVDNTVANLSGTTVTLRMTGY